MSLRGMVRYIMKSVMGKQGQMPQPGDPAPEFSVTTSTGDPLKLSDLRGRWVVLWFFPKADTPG